ncbi:MAG: hypothetical protein C4532_08335 [Candidatus Abyssobacteria bacterium SURF_17]|uniref:Transcription factor zinc-finger domain-containing protein n=1 Tax=Candidatus Abyssobacteria bacterium SURF_17 TaxID=2093361 RepID=A0A419F0G1_9BACT|nr:MAG: hypothetical protein C4532_08335 [Candidatus Abyssubacteria bacterium SURF_17]
MTAREATSHYGTKLSVFQCAECSGIWVDRDVAFSLSRDSALAVETDVELEEISTTAREVPLFCPRCEVYLTEQGGGTLPKGLRIDYCTTCHGFWFDKGELMIYKSFLEEKRQKSREKLKLEEEEQRMRRERLKQSPEFAQLKMDGELSGWQYWAIANVVGRILVRLLFRKI